jgi:hypothetical protein
MFRSLVKLPFKIISSCLSIILGSLIILVVVFWFYSTVVLKQDFNLFQVIQDSVNSIWGLWKGDDAS